MRSDLVELYEFMRARGIVHVRCGDVELTLGPLPIAELQLEPEGRESYDHSDPYDDPDLWADGIPPTLDGATAPQSPTTRGEEMPVEE